ncbi:MAG TPA: peptidyl-prolyl cis-trans isomerase [Terriglobales bacterium]|nr:peptidyl-prolyl cis-trans isomerase [Terriglobales bacterium]
MFRLLLILLIASATAVAQTTGSSSKTAVKGQASSTARTGKSAATHKAGAGTAPAGEAVITVKGLCASATDGIARPAPASTKEDCVSIVSKSSFEELMHAVAPNIPPNMKKNVAQQLVELLALAQAAQKAGIDKEPSFAEFMRVQRLTVLGNLYGRSLDEKYKHPPQSEIDAYYKEHQGDFQEAKLRRVYVPKIDPTGKSTTPEQKTAYSEKAKKIADDMYARAQKGEDMQTLQKDAYTALGITTTPPPAELGAIRKGALSPQTDKAVFALSPGGATMADEPAAFIIYKLDTKQQLSEDKVKEEISRMQYQQKMQGRRKEISSSVQATFDDKYFGAGVPAEREGPAAAPPVRPGAVPAHSPSPSATPSPKSK